MLLLRNVSSQNENKGERDMDTKLDTTLKHFGVKGMKWGVRKSGNDAGPKSSITKRINKQLVKTEKKEAKAIAKADKKYLKENKDIIKERQNKIMTDTKVDKKYVEGYNKLIKEAKAANVKITERDKRDAATISMASAIDNELKKQPKTPSGSQFRTQIYLLNYEMLFGISLHTPQQIRERDSD